MKTSFKFLSIFTLTAASICGFSPLHAKPFSQETVRSTSNEIDQLVAAYLQKNKVKANPIIDDATFLRRSYISISGRIPTAKEARTFLSNPTKDKRKTLVDTLVNSSGYNSQMFNFWADLLRLQTNQEKFGLGWHQWIRESVENNKPYDEFVNEMLAAEGLATENPAVGYYLRDRNMLLDNVSNSAQIFLGTQIGCAQCHDHPFDDLTQKQYYEFAAFIGDTTYQSDAAQHMVKRMTDYTMKKKGNTPPAPRQTKNKKEQKKNQKLAKNLNRNYSSIFRDFRKNATGTNPRKTLRLPKDYKYNDGKPGDLVTPKSLFGDPIKLTSTDNHQQVFADWITNPNNPRFTKVIVNRLWDKVFGRGIVGSLDDWSETTKVSHPELLDYLCKVMKATDYDVQQFMRVLYHTRLFESAVASQEAKRSGSYDFRGPVLRRMSAEELHDSFIVLKLGNRDESKNNSIKAKWDTHVQQVDTLFKMPLSKVIALDQAADKREKEVFALRAKERKLKLQVNKAKSAGDTQKAAQLQKQLHQEYAANKKALNKRADDMVSMIMARNLRVNANTPTLRASEKPAPAKPGSFMRQFGGSDREVTNASHTQASIPQVLSLLNGQELDSLTYKKNFFAKGLTQTDNPSERLEHLFLSIYGQIPTEAEHQRYGRMMQNPKDIKPLVKAMLNSKRFLFVQ